LGGEGPSYRNHQNSTPSSIHYSLPRIVRRIGGRPLSKKGENIFIKINIRRMYYRESLKKRGAVVQLVYGNVLDKKKRAGS